MRRDVLDVQIRRTSRSTVNEHDGYVNGPKTLIIQTVLPTGSADRGLGLLGAGRGAAHLVQRRREVGVGGARSAARVLGRRRRSRR